MGTRIRGLHAGDALIVVDVQRDFLPGGALAVPEGDRVIPVLNRVAAEFASRGLPVFATRDWHPPNHCSFRAQGGPWPPHCVADTPGAEIPADVQLAPDTQVISKATTPEKDAYSGFEGTDLLERLRTRGATRVFVGGLATDYCVKQTVLDALANGLDVVVLEDAIRAVEAEPGDGARALQEMRTRGAIVATTEDILAR
ncbi:MAG TPA: nicotinamidase [Steroidobacteraceae bacterium]|nr:nicotinamidase [Steroidobacteraceae bacterium]